MEPENKNHAKRKRFFLAIGLQAVLIIVVGTMYFITRNQIKAIEDHWDSIRSNTLISSDGYISEYKSADKTSVESMVMAMDDNFTKSNLPELSSVGYENLVLLDLLEKVDCTVPADLTGYVKIVTELKGDNIRLIYHDLNGVSCASCPVNSKKERIVYLPYAEADTLAIFSLFRAFNSIEKEFEYAVRMYDHKDSLLAKFPLNEAYLKGKLIGIKKYPVKDTLRIKLPVVLAHK